MKKVYYLMSFLLIIIGIIGVAFTAKDFIGGEVVSGEAIYTAEHIEAVVITSDVAAIRVLPTMEKEIKVEWSESLRKSEEIGIQVEEDKGTLAISIENNRLLGSLNFSFGFNVNMLAVDVYLPQKQFELIRLENNVGSAEISSIHAQDVTVKSDVAKITLDDVVASTIEATSAVGSIEITNSTGELRAMSDVGKIEIASSEITNDIQLQTEVGSIKVRVPTVPDNVSFNGFSEIGSIEVFGEKGSYLSKEADYIVTMQTEIGSIKVIATN